MNIKGILFISFILLVFTLAAASASDLGHIAISDSYSDGSVLAHVPVTVSSHDDSVLIDDNLKDMAVDDSSIDDGQSVPDVDSSIDDGDKSIPADADSSTIDDGDKSIPDDKKDSSADVDGDINDGDSIIINITNDTSKNNYNDKPISNVKEASGSFDDLQSLIDQSPKGTYLLLYRDYEATDENEVVINKDFIIDGQGHTLDCVKKCRAIYSHIGNIVLRNLNFINGYVDDHYLDINKDNGGAICIEGGSKYTIENCKFVNNWADDRGGAIFTGYSENTHKLINCIFINNTADDNSGGAIHSCAHLAVENCIFLKNRSNFDGGAIYSQGVTVATNCTFKDNAAGLTVEHICPNPSEGGAIYARYGLDITNCTFVSNYADDDGGAVVTCGDLHINDKQGDDEGYNTFFYGNSVDDWEAGAAKCWGSAFIKNTVFDSNNAWTDGGALYVELGVAHVTHCLFHSNKCAGAISQCEGGAIYAKIGLNTRNCIFNYNYAEDDGGALYCEKLIQVYNSTFFGNTAEDYGGAIYSEDSVKINPTTPDCLCQFINNEALDDKGGAIYADDDVYGFNASFISNVALVDGGAIFSDYVDLVNCSFKYNRAEGASSKCYGGAIRTYTAKVISCIFRENYSENHGGAIFTNTFSEAVKNCTFYFNQAREDGGAVYINKENDVLFTQCTFIINRCLDQGGAIYADSCSSKISLSNNLFKGNHAETEGHVVFNYGYFGEILNNWWADNIPTEENGLLVEHKYCSSNINHVDSNPLRLAISCPGVLMVGKVAFAELYFVKSDGSEFTGEIPVLMEFVLPAEYKMKNSFITENSVLISFIPQMGGMFTISCNLFGEVVSVTSKVTGDSSFAGNSVDSGFANANSSIVKSTMVNTQFAKSLCDFPQAHDDFNSYSSWLLILSIFGL